MQLHYTYIKDVRNPPIPRTSQHPKETSFNLRIDPALKVAFTASTGAEAEELRWLAALVDQDDLGDERKA